MELLGHIPSLSSLDLSGSSIQDAGIKGLRNNPQFRHLMLAELMDISDDGLQVCSCYVACHMTSHDVCSHHARTEDVL